MKKIMFALFALIVLLAACQSGASDDTSTRYVVNSKWQTVRTVEVAARAVSEADLTAEVLAYNLATTDDQQTILEEEVPIEESPIIDVYIVHPTTHAIIESYLDWDRADYVDRYALFVQQAQAGGGVLYVDQIPPPEVIPDDPRTEYEKYALYLVAADGSILYEEHCADADWVGLGWSSLEVYYMAHLKNYELQARCDGDGEYVVTGKIYTAP